jgi:hypothetical protein
MEIKLLYADRFDYIEQIIRQWNSSVYQIVSQFVEIARS